ncbi:MAG TPA: hypothetical protein PK430_05200 [Muribaculum sp.]|uniref:Uncharacterized protein n=1 Tax=Heminiphilus faecis TaxID=2601703 RepID=A0ABV4CV76_9BACT|nr:hypothetical protein [Heminiphilus faecis]HRF68603.1 hypothetical protein [Muribaculum sp.]
MKFPIYEARFKLTYHNNINNGIILSDKRNTNNPVSMLFGDNHDGFNLIGD